MKVLMLTLVGLNLGLSACALFSRHPGSGYSDDYGMERESVRDFYAEKKQHRQAQTMQELGLPLTSALTEQETDRLNSRLELKRLEGLLESSREKKQYYHYKPMMVSDRQKIYFLRISTVEGRERWAQSQGLPQRQNRIGPQFVKAIEQNDVIVGMNRQAVRESWGDPDMVEVAGNQVYGNERWKYAKMVSSDSGYNKEMRVIYFESGRVVGWEKL